jgi:hypothetical protein
MVNSTKAKLLVILELVLTPFIVALILHYFDGVVLFSIGLFIFFILIRTGIITKKQMGLRIDNLLKTLPIYLLFYGITVACAYIVKISGIPFDKEVMEYRMMWLVFLSAVVQEIYYRGYLSFRLRAFTQNKLMIALIISMLFSMSHVILMPIIGYNWNLLIFSFFLSMWWTISYLNNPNLYLMILWHFVNNFVLYSIVLA